MSEKADKIYGTIIMKEFERVKEGKKEHREKYTAH